MVEDDATRIHAGGWELARRSWAERLTAARRLPQDLAKRAARQCALSLQSSDPRHCTDFVLVAVRRHVWTCT